MRYQKSKQHDETNEVATKPLDSSSNSFLVLGSAFAAFFEDPFLAAALPLGAAETVPWIQDSLKQASQLQQQLSTIEYVTATA